MWTRINNKMYAMKSINKQNVLSEVVNKKNKFDVDYRSYYNELVGEK